MSMDVAGKRPGRPAGFQRDEALDSLLTLFWQGGYEGATQQAMMQATSLSSSSLYRTFGTKQQTFEAVLRRYLELADWMLTPLERGHEGSNDLRAFLDRVEDQLAGLTGSAGCLVVAAIQDPVNSDPRIAELTRRHLARMREAIGAAAARGESELPADAIFAGVIGALAIARSGDRNTVASVIGALRDLL